MLFSMQGHVKQCVLYSILPLASRNCFEICDQGVNQIYLWVSRSLPASFRFRVIFTKRFCFLLRMNMLVLVS